jgi:hypothetical protein
LKAQESGDDNQAVISIIGADPVQSNNAHDFINTNPYYQTKIPPDQKTKVQKNQNIEPTLENGFHMRFEISANQPIEQIGTSSFSPSDDDYGEIGKKHGNKIGAHKSNLKRRLKRLFPARQKKYRPTLCGRF